MVSGRLSVVSGRLSVVSGGNVVLTGVENTPIKTPMGKTIQVAADRAFDQAKTVLPAEVARGVYMRNTPSLQALKLMHLMIATAGGHMAEEVQHDIRLSEIRRIEGMKNHDRASLTPLFEELRAAVLTFDDPEAMEVTIGGFLDEAVIKYRHEVSGDILVSWYFARTFRRMAEESNHWAILDRQTVFHLGSKYSVLLFQHVASLAGLEFVREKTFTIPELRALLGVPEGQQKRFADLNRNCLQMALSEINQLSRLTLTVRPNKIGRTVASVTIGWQENGDPREAKRELAASKVGRKARRDGTSETVPTAFPATGGIAYSPRWLDIKKAAGCNTDNQKIAADFRRFLSDRGIVRDAGNIEKLFAEFCRKVGKV